MARAREHRATAETRVAEALAAEARAEYRAVEAAAESDSRAQAAAVSHAHQIVPYAEAEEPGRGDGRGGLSAPSRAPPAASAERANAVTSAAADESSTPRMPPPRVSWMQSKRGSGVMLEWEKLSGFETYEVSLRPTHRPRPSLIDSQPTSRLPCLSHAQVQWKLLGGADSLPSSAGSGWTSSEASRRITGHCCVKVRRAPPIVSEHSADLSEFGLVSH